MEQEGEAAMLFFIRRGMMIQAAAGGKHPANGEIIEFSLNTH